MAIRRKIFFTFFEKKFRRHEARSLLHSHAVSRYRRVLAAITFRARRKETMKEPHESHQWTMLATERRCARCRTAADWPLAQQKCVAFETIDPMPSMITKAGEAK